MMTGLGPLLASLAALDIASLTARLKRNAVLYGFALIFLFTAYVLLVAALAVYLGQTWGMPVALVVVAGGALLLGLIMFLWVALANRAEQRRKRVAAAAGGNKALMMTAALSALPVLVKSRPLLLASVAAGLGFLVMRSTGSGARYRGPAE
jgi:hypothetical protein